MSKVKLIKTDLGVHIKKDKVVATSRDVARVFNKRHDNVLRDIKKIKEDMARINHLRSEEIDFEKYFIKSTYKDSRGRKYPQYDLTRDGFMLLTMGFTGEEALMFKLAFINDYNKMEEKLASLQELKLEYPALTEAIKDAHKEPKFYHYTNENNLIYRIVLGMTAAEFKKKHGIKNEESLRPYLTKEQVDMVMDLQKYNTSLIKSGFSYEERKEFLQRYFDRNMKQAN